MRPSWPKLAVPAQKTCILNSFQIFGVILASFPLSTSYRPDMTKILLKRM